MDTDQSSLQIWPGEGMPATGPAGHTYSQDLQHHWPWTLEAAAGPGMDVLLVALFL